MTSINCFSQANEVSLKLFDLTIFQTERVGLEKFSYISKDTFFCNYIILKNPVLECNSTGLFLNAGLMNSDFYKSIEWCKYRDTLFVNHIIDYFSYINVSRVYNDLHIFGTFNKDSIKLSTQINNLTTNINVYPNPVIQNLNIRRENLENV